VIQRLPLATLLASLAAHGGVIAILFLLVSGETHPSVLFIDLETLPERAAPGAGAVPSPGPAGGSTKRAASGSARPAGRAPDRSAPASASSTAPPSPVAPAPPAEPVPPKERETATAPPEVPRQPGPAVAAVPPRETAPEVAARTEASTPALEPRVSPGSADAGSVASPSETAGGQRGAAGAETTGGGTSGGGARGGGGNVVASSGPAGGTPGAEYGSYLAQMRRRLMEALRYPPPARSRGLSGTVLLDISIESSGAIADVSVTRSSSHPLLDEAALEAARSLSPQPFPKGLAPRPLRVRLPVVFDLQ